MVNPVLIVLTVMIMLLSLSMIFARNPISSAFSLVGLMVALGGIYAMIGAHFVAALQIIVYAGAVMVLFIFSIMLLNMNEEKGEIDFASWKTYAALGVSLGLTGFFGVAFLNWSHETGLPTPDIYSLQKIKEIGGNVVSVSGLLFSQMYIQFELISLLLLVAIAGALVLAKRKVD
ncbi:MAG: NADH-quinone oxidoreductase subunit J [Pseudobdellovibrionaceae bacterium]|nr:NADH-quinone oxidoreductase subunit J [Pseudobdellovibrionaceae bacterium]